MGKTLAPLRYAEVVLNDALSHHENTLASLRCAEVV
jgi:hypothetical protein